MIERLVSSAVYLVLPIVGIFLFDWDWRSVIVLYWLQNITVGIRTEIDMIRTRTPEAPGESVSLTFNGRQVTGSAQKPLMVVFFAVHYGIFTLVHGVFVFLIVSGVFNGLFQASGGAGSTGGAGPAWLPGALTQEATFDLRGIIVAWAIGSIVQFVLAAMAPSENLPPLRKLFFAPYARIFVLHFTVIIGVFLITRFDWPPAAAILLVALQFVVDLWRPLNTNSKTPNTLKTAI
ncbi:DUF6498-containing protein [Leucobacter denitrificans]|uniref:Uncharacterized protein n=1 Tax=Leucobacter denitrificans TaxID=683042 RepID=A0A7G9S2Q5_9MICO|nr:DUF6498-containing protein [Leucobacter denitrificans]QNN62130.1 hypothetical protein H9L06_07465 [Leucobacter denitrificans]